MENLLIELAKQGPVIGILIYFIYYFKNELSKKDERINSLIDCNQENDIENMKSLLAINQSLEKLTDKSDTKHIDLIEKLKDIKEEVQKIIFKQ